MLHPYVPLCMCCGLILCAIVSPSPLSTPSPPCPSCAAPILDEQSRFALIAQLDATLARLSHEHEEHAARVRQERLVARQGKREQADGFPTLHGGASSHAFPSTAAHSHYFAERQKQMDIAMGRRVEEESERRFRVVRIGGKTSTEKGKKKKKKKAAEGQREAGSLTETKENRGGAGKARLDVDATAPSDEETASASSLTIAFDAPNDPLAPISDVYDDGFRSRWPQLLGVQGRSSHTQRGDEKAGWWYSPSTLRYVASTERQAKDAEAGKDEVVAHASVAASRHVPGATEDMDGRGKGRRKAKK